MQLDEEFKRFVSVLFPGMLWRHLDNFGESTSGPAVKWRLDSDGYLVVRAMTLGLDQESFADAVGSILSSACLEEENTQTHFDNSSEISVGDGSSERPLAQIVFKEQDDRGPCARITVNLNTCCDIYFGNLTFDLQQ